MNATHDHDHHHAGHAHGPSDFGKAFAMGTALNLAFVVIEAGFGFISNSMALFADAGHNLSDVLGLVIAWIAAILAKRPPGGRYTYGLRRSSILAALFNAVFLLVAVGAIAWEAILRLVTPEPISGLTVTIVAAIGILINGFTAFLFASGRKGDLNIRGAYLHMAADALVSAGVVLGGLLIILTNWLWLDAIISLIIVAVIVAGTWSLLSSSLAMSMDAVPRGIVLDDVRSFLLQCKGIAAIHDLHIWPMSTTEVALTAHLVMPDGHPGDDFLARTAEELRAHHGIHHATLQIETDASATCVLEPDHVV
jgi:cobalt-zinc-cadmium efflux system protein